MMITYCVQKRQNLIKALITTYSIFQKKIKIIPVELKLGRISFFYTIAERDRHKADQHEFQAFDVENSYTVCKDFEQFLLHQNILIKCIRDKQKTCLKKKKNRLNK